MIWPNIKVKTKQNFCKITIKIYLVIVKYIYVLVVYRNILVFTAVVVGCALEIAVLCCCVVLACGPHSTCVGGRRTVWHWQLPNTLCFVSSQGHCGSSQEEGHRQKTGSGHWHGGHHCLFSARLIRIPVVNSVTLQGPLTGGQNLIDDKM